MRFASQRGSARPCTTCTTRRVELGGRTLLDRLTWQIGPGDRIGIVGVNGSGKTTLLRLLAGELRADRRARSCAA